MPHICTYEMMKPHSFAVEMQNEAIQAIEKNKPSCIVFVNLPTSWGLDLKPELPFFQWLRSYLATNYVVDGIVDLVSEERTIYKWGEEVRSYQPESPYTMWLFLRKDRESVRD